MKTTRDCGAVPPKPATIPNTYRVPPKQWRRWTQAAKIVFNDLYRVMRDNQELFAHPNATEIPARHWSTVAWNASWLAADAADQQPPLPKGSLVRDYAGRKIVREHVVQ